MLAIDISRDHKEKYLKSFSEDDLRDRVVRPLFLRLGYSDGRDLCGPEEHGRDALFCETHRLGRKRYIALQTKKGNLSLAGTTSKNLINAVTQLRTALETSYALISPVKQKIRPDEVILCCSGTINDAARNHIVDELDDNRLQFLDRDEVINLVDERFPELWLDIETSVQPYLTELRKLAEDDFDHVLRRSILRQPVSSQCLSDASFVELRLAAPSVKKRKRLGKVYRTPEFEEINGSTLLEVNSSRILILGDPGSGKSTLLLRLAYIAARKSAVAEKTYQVPVALRAASIQTDDVEEFVEFLISNTKNITGSKISAFSNEDLDAGRLVLLIDALDEIGSLQHRTKVASLLGDFLERYPNVKVIITARPYLSLRDLGVVKSFKRYRISPISFKQGEKMLKAHLQGKEIGQGHVNEILRKVEEVHGFELNPLLVTIFSATAQFGQSDLPANVTELFKKFTELMLGRWDEEKGLGQQIHMPIKDFLLRQIAYRMHCRQETEISKEEFRSIAYQELRSRGHAASTDALLHEMVDRSGLFRVKEDVLEFRHHMLQEFFAGRGIPSLEDIKSRLHDDWWRRPIIFYFGEKPENAGTLEDVVTSAHGIDKGRNFEIAITAGLALQACYLASADEKIELWKWVASSLGLGYQDFLKVLSEYEDYPTLNFLLAYLIARDSVALSLVQERIDELKEWANSEQDLLNSNSEQRLFWLATALVEIGDMKSFLELIPDIRKLDLKYQFALFTGCSLVERVRAVNTSTKRLAKEAQQMLIESARGIGPQVASELGSQLLELRKGKLVAIEE